MKSLQEYLMESNELNMGFAKSIYDAIFPIYIKSMKEIIDKFKITDKDVDYFLENCGVNMSGNEKMIEKLVKEFWLDSLHEFESCANFEALEKNKLVSFTLENLAQKDPSKKWHTESGRIFHFWSRERNKIDQKLDSLIGKSNNPFFNLSCIYFGIYFLNNNLPKFENADCEFGKIKMDIHKSFGNEFRRGFIGMDITYFPK